MVIAFLRSIILYFVVIFSVRLMGKRQIGELQPSELVITILVSNIATLPLEDIDTPILIGVVSILSLVCLDVLMSWCTLKSRRMRRFISGVPKVIIKDGVIDQRTLKELRFSVDDLMTALRGNNVFDLNDVEFAIVETTGAVSLYQKFERQNVTNSDLKIKGKSQNPPELIITDGELIEHSLETIGLNEMWLSEILKKKSLEIKGVFLMTADKDGNYYLAKKDGSNDKN
jgi:uncharacterized membrane protein YcaP (DUF421 family)